MPYVTGAIGPSGAIVDVLVGVHSARAKVLRKSGFSVPELVHARALIDTGASLSALSPRIITALDLRPFDHIAVITPSTTGNSPDIFDRHLVSLSMVAEGRPCPFPDLYV